MDGRDSPFFEKEGSGSFVRRRNKVQPKDSDRISSAYGGEADVRDLSSDSMSEKVVKPRQHFARKHEIEKKSVELNKCSLWFRNKSTENEYLQFRRESNLAQFRALSGSIGIVYLAWLPYDLALTVEEFMAVVVTLRLTYFSLAAIAFGLTFTKVFRSKRGHDLIVNVFAVITHLFFLPLTLRKAFESTAAGEGNASCFTLPAKMVEDLHQNVTTEGELITLLTTEEGHQAFWFFSIWVAVFMITFFYLRIRTLPALACCLSSLTIAVMTGAAMCDHVAHVPFTLFLVSIWRDVVMMLLILSVSFFAAHYMDSLARKAFAAWKINEAANKALASADEIVRENEAKKRFLANLSHELRTPVHGILAMSEMLLTDSLGDEQRENAMVIKRCTESLSFVITDILTMAAMDAGTFKPNLVHGNLRSTLENTAFGLSSLAHKKGLSCFVHIPRNCPVECFGGVSHLQQILSNLFTNSTKFSQKGAIWVEAQVEGAPLDVGMNIMMKESKEQREKILKSCPHAVKVVVSVRDEGIGIKQDAMSRLFQRFDQLHGIVDEGPKAKVAGTGLGLAISKNLCKMLGGDIKCESVYSKGSMFTASMHLLVSDPVVRTHDAHFELLRSLPPIGMPGGSRAAETLPLSRQLQLAHEGGVSKHVVVVSNTNEIPLVIRNYSRSLPEKLATLTCRHQHGASVESLVSSLLSHMEEAAARGMEVKFFVDVDVWRHCGGEGRDAVDDGFSRVTATPPLLDGGEGSLPGSTAEVTRGGGGASAYSTATHGKGNSMASPKRGQRRDSAFSHHEGLRQKGDEQDGSESAMGLRQGGGRSRVSSKGEIGTGQNSDTAFISQCLDSFLCTMSDEVKKRGLDVFSGAVRRLFLLFRLGSPEYIAYKKWTKQLASDSTLSLISTRVTILKKPVAFSAVLRSLQVWKGAKASVEGAKGGSAASRVKFSLPEVPSATADGMDELEQPNGALVRVEHSGVDGRDEVREAPYVMSLPSLLVSSSVAVESARGGQPAIPVISSVDARNMLTASSGDVKEEGESEISVVRDENELRRGWDSTAPSVVPASIVEELKARKPLSEVNIVLVEDDTATLMALSGYLKNFGASVTCFDDPSTALLHAMEVVKPKAEARDILAFVVDRKMPVMRGDDFVRQLRSIEVEVDSIKSVVVGVSGAFDEGDIDDFKNAGLDCLLQKPCEVLVIVETLARLLAKRAAENSAPSPSFRRDLQMIDALLSDSAGVSTLLAGGKLSEVEKEKERSPKRSVAEREGDTVLDSPLVRDIEMSERGGAQRRTRLMEEEEDSEVVGGRTITPDVNDIGLSDMLVLVVDDEKPCRMVGKKMVERLGIAKKVIAASNGKEALALLEEEEEAVDLVLMDCNMPVMDGYEATVEIKRREWKHRHAIILATTAGGDPEKCVQSGMDGIMRKPFTPIQIMDQLKHCSGGSER
uniref:Histidine kinase n=1 Tax=Palpitomonas bilix TaxID=652834 RepID=A0A7S3G254_9EUKA|mmetsp:Transcript_19592/g.50204  ORF Transcript_19592/g.50204 Transcript_19592/m.50204 type:complete len:1439 (+) Transcript_19592:201-4517(+)